MDASTFGFSADDIGDYMIDVLAEYNRKLSDIEFLTGDNCAVNQSLAEKITRHLRDASFGSYIVPLVGCASHRLNLAVQMFYEDPTSKYYSLVNKVSALMVELRTLKSRYKLASRTKLSPIKRNDTRWGSVYSMLRRYLELHDILLTCSFPRSFLHLIPTAAEKDEIQELTEKLKNCEEASVFLQQQDPVKVSLELVRAAFDTLIADYPFMKRYLSSTADIVHDKAFESAVVKIQRGAENTLNAAEKKSVARFKIDVTAQSNDSSEEASYMDKIRASGSAKIAKKSNYACLNHVSATSNVVERLFSRAKLVMTDQRRSMDPSTLEAILMLRYNHDIWDVYLLDSLVQKLNASSTFYSFPR